LLYVIIAHYNRPYLHWADSRLLSYWAEPLTIIGFGIYTLWRERNAYTRRRLTVLVALVATIWWLLPEVSAHFGLEEPMWGSLPAPFPFPPGIHIPGKLSFFLVLGLAFLFGRRVDCGWNCTCVGLRETAGQPFREATLRGEKAWQWRHLRWLSTGYLFLYLALLCVPATAFSLSVYRWFWRLVDGSYFFSLLLVPLLGNRNYCRYVCPFGALYGLLNVLGFYRIRAEPEKCRGCGRCERECDMGIPVQRLVRERGEVNVVDCMGCGRCVTECPAGVLHFEDVRSRLFGWNITPRKRPAQPLGDQVRGT